MIENSNWSAYPFSGGFFEQPADLMDDVFLVFDIEAYQEAIEKENGDEDAGS